MKPKEYKIDTNFIIKVKEYMLPRPSKKDYLADKIESLDELDFITVVHGIQTV